MATKELISTQEERDNLIMFFTYVILYSNDMVCFCSNRLRGLEHLMDKEDKKRHSAATKRISNYKDALSNILQEKEVFLAYYYEHVDNEVDVLLNQLFEEVRIVVEHTYDESQRELLTMVAYSSIVANIVVDIEDSAFKEMKDQQVNPLALTSYRFNKLQDIYLDWLRWFSVKKRQPIVVDNECLDTIAQKIKETICSAELFCEAYKYAHYNELEYQNELQYQDKSFEV